MCEAKRRMPHDQVNAGIADILLAITTAYSVDNALNPLYDRGPINTEVFDINTKPGAGSRQMSNLRAPNESFCGIATNVEAGPANFPTLDQRHSSAKRVELERRGAARSSGANNDNIERGAIFGTH